MYKAYSNLTPATNSHAVSTTAWQTAHSPAPAMASATPMISITGAQQNELLRALSRSDLERLFCQLELVALPAGKHLFDFGAKIDYTYFPTNAIVSLLYVMEDGATTEIAVVGREGVAGVALRSRTGHLHGRRANGWLWLPPENGFPARSLQ